MKINNNKLKLLVIVLILFLCSLFINIRNSFGIYKSNLSTPINLTVLDPEANYVVTFDLNDGSGNTSLEYRLYNQPIGTLPTPTRENYNFDGWYATFENNVYSNPVTASTVVTGDMTLYAKWLPIQIYTVTFDANGGTINGESTFTLEINAGSIINKEDYPEAILTGKYFDEWYTEQELTNVFDESTPITSTITLYAGWTDNLYVAKVNNVKYTTLAEAITKVPAGLENKTRVTILHDITLTSLVSIPSNKWVEIDGGSYTIDGTVNLFTNNGKLDIISGNYVINTTTENKAYSLILNKSTGTLNISGGNLKSKVTKQGDYSVVENAGGTINVSGGHLECAAQSAVINHKNNGTLYVTGGELIGTNTIKGQAVYIVEGAKAYISGDAYLENVSVASGNNARAAVDNVGGTLEITGGTIVSKSYNAVMSRDATAVTIIGNEEDDEIDITKPVMRGERYGLEKKSGTVSVYDGLFESYTQAIAISDTNVPKPSNAIFETKETITIDDKSYHKAYLYALNYKVNFLPENGESMTSITVDNGEEIGVANMPENPIRENYYFEGWFINGDTLYPVTSETIVKGNMNVKAVWTPTIKLATIPETLKVSLGYTNTISVTDIPDGMESYTFSTSNNQIATVDANGVVTGVEIGSTNIIITGSKSNLTVQVAVEVSILKYTITFKDDDNSPVTSVEVVPGHSIGDQMPADLVRTNYIFKGWYINGNISTPFTNEVVVDGDITVIAIWRLELNSATVTINPDPLVFKKGKTGEITVSSTNGVVEECTFLSSNSNFVEVSTNSSNPNVATLTGVEVGTVTITIKGTDSGQTIPVTVEINNLNNITFDPDNGESVTTVQVADGESIDSAGVTIPSNLTKDGYILDWWYRYDGTNLTDTPLDTSKTITSDEVYKASWAPTTSYAGIGPHYYASISDAIAAVTTSDETEIKVLQDIPATVGQTIIPAGRNIVLNGGNHTVDCGTTAEKQLIMNNGTLRIISGTYTCNISNLAVLENNKNAHMYIEGGTVINYNNRSAIFIGGGVVEISGGEFSSSATVRPVIYNATSGASLIVSGGTITQTVIGNVVTTGSDPKDDGRGAIKITTGTTATITGGTIISTASNSAAIYAPGGTLTIGTKNDAYDNTTPILQGENYGVMSNVDYSVYDGIIKGKTNNSAVNNIDKITGTEDNSTLVTGQDGDFYTLYYSLSTAKYHIDFNANDGEVSPSEKEFNINTTISTSDLPTPMRENYTFDGWYTDSTLQTPFVEFTPATPATVTYYAKWTINS